MSEPRPTAMLDPGSIEQIELLERFRPGSKRQLATLFRASFARDLATCSDALQHGDAVRLRQAAHSIKGSAAGLGATSLSRQAAGIEGLAASGDPAAARAALESLELAFADAWAVLGTWLSEPPENA